MTSNIVVVAAGILLAGLVHCQPQTFDLLELCGQTHLVTSSALLVADVDGYSGTAENCQVKVVSRHENLFNHLRLQLLDVDSDCRYLRMYIRDVKTSWHSDNICGTGWSSIMYETSDTAVIDVWKVGGYFNRNMKFTLLATSFSNDISSGDFVCDNSESIDDRLRCDGYNNCGDWSDERSCTFLTWPWKVAFIVGGCGLGLVIAVVIVVHVIRRRNRRAAHNALTRAPVATPVKQTEVPGLPSYGSIAAFPPPPPYSAVDSQVNVPPASPPVYQTEEATEATPTGR
ncbi:uncharacterized protein LOC112576745 [Pomacea canaliculata]|uniref:uncharacterized protein LOC112576745 n=1 Tax=Pomacea canaliculata TaxID=400727 RepID=UPI000D738E6D|nr:uncharacterized protein LOC112576745 [Pomacea canaliculata]